MMERSTTVGRSSMSGISAAAQAALVLGFAVLTAIGAQVEIPHHPVPFTLQTLFVLLAGSLLGKRHGALSMGAYLLAGLFGMPVFSGAGFGLAKFLGPTGGYLLAFPAAAYLVGAIAGQQRSLIRILIAHISGLLLIFTLGTFHLWATYLHDVGQAFNSGFLLFSWWDLLKIGAATGLAYGISRR